jgi:integrase
MKERVLLTDRFVQTLPPAAKGKRNVIYDAMLKGLAVRVTDTGAASFYVSRIWHSGSHHPTGKKLGAVTEMTVSQAREKFIEWKKQHKAGLNPSLEERRARRLTERKTSDTFASVLTKFCRAKKHQRQIYRTERDIRRDCRSLLERPVSDIERRDIVELIRAMKERGVETTAHNTFANLNRIFNWAVDNDILESSPMARLRPTSLIGSKTVRQRVLTDGEIVAVWRATKKLGYPYQHLFQLLLLTGQRRTEVGEAHWSEFDFEARVWVIPEERFKSGSAHRVPLTDDAIAILNDCPRFAGGDYVFTSRNGSTFANDIDGALTKLGKIILADGGQPLPRWTVHDLRRTMRTRLSSLRIPSEIAEMCIGHAKKGLARIYDQHAYETEMREAMNAWAGLLRSIVSPTPSNVIAIRG